MPILHFLIGLPGSGKSTWLKENQKDCVILSTDNWIESRAITLKKTYNEVFHDAIYNAEEKMYSLLNYAISEDKNIIWDQTNCSKKIRIKKLKRIPAHYEKRAIVFLTHENIIDRVNEERLAFGRSIPVHVMNSMKQSFVIPTKEEGFDSVTIIERKN